MAVTIQGADQYIALNCIDVEDWTGSEYMRKQRILNVCSRTIAVKYAAYTIPDAAVYEFANVIAIAYNDTNRLQTQGVSAFSLSGVASFTFKDALITKPSADLTKLIPQSALDAISAANGGVKIATKTVAWTVM